MRVSRIQAEENRQTVINVASRLFRERGFDGIGLKDLMEGAGLTQGAFYKQFASKEDLAAQASRRAIGERLPSDGRPRPRRTRGSAWRGDRVLPQYGASRRKDGRLPDRGARLGCRQTGRDVKASFEAGIKAHLEILGRLIAETDGEESNGKAMAILSTMVGALTLSRVVNDSRSGSGLSECGRRTCSRRRPKMPC